MHLLFHNAHILPSILQQPTASSRDCYPFGSYDVRSSVPAGSHAPFNRLGCGGSPQMRRVECVPPSDLVVNVDSNEGGDAWIRLSIQVTARSHKHANLLRLA